MKHHYLKTLALYIITILNFDSTAQPKVEQVSVPNVSRRVTVIGPTEKYRFSTTVTWGDEFGYSGLPDSGKWGMDIGNGYYGWGNNEQQYYTNRTANAIVNGNILKIIAKNESYKGFHYTSAKLNTKHTKMFQYGRFDIRAKLPKTEGMWPAIFLFGHTQTWYNMNSWPECGEIDILELNGNRNNFVHTNLHCGYYNYRVGRPVTRQTDIGNAADQWNNYRVDWTPSYIRWFINNVQVAEFLNDGGNHSHWPFDDYFNLMLSLSVGGNFVGKIDPGALPQAYEIDYVRYYKLLGKYDPPVLQKKPAAPVINKSAGTKYQSSYFSISTVAKPLGSTIRWYAGGIQVSVGDNFVFPPETPLGVHKGVAVAVVDGVESLPATVTVTVVPDP